jgi:hypothetical protein
MDIIFRYLPVAPMPLLIRLGTLFTDKIQADVYQLRREPEQTWQWDSDNTSIVYKVIDPQSYGYPPVLIISLSARIAKERITAVLGTESIDMGGYNRQSTQDFLRCRQQLSDYEA